MRLLPIGCIPIILGLEVSSCSTEECYDNQSSLPLAGFYSSAATPQAITIDSISVWGIGAPGDSMLLDSAINVSRLYLPFRIDSQTTSYVFRNVARGASGAMADTVSFCYNTVPEFVSEACGVIYRYEDVKASTTTHFIDSVSCPTGLIDNVSTENLKIYFKVSSSSGN